MKIRRDHIAILCAAVIGIGAGIGVLLYLAAPPRTAEKSGAERSPAPPGPAVVTAPVATSAAPPPQTTAAAAPEKPVPRIETTDCWFEVPAGKAARCGELVVAENIADPHSRPLALRFVVFVGSGAAHATDPVIFISGGPGDPAQIDARTIGRWWSWVGRAPWLGQRDLVVFDQRGVGVSEPK